MAAPIGNKFALGNTGGRPPMFELPEDLENKCLQYFNDCIDNVEKPTITGLTLYVGFCSRSSWDLYSDKEEFKYIVKRAKLTVEYSYEKSATTFDMFALKNMGWKDKTELDHTTKGETINHVSLGVGQKPIK